MANTKQTSKRAATAASKVLRDGRTSKQGKQDGGGQRSVSDPWQKK